MAPRSSRSIVRLAGAVAALTLATSAADAQTGSGTPPLTQLQFDIVGIRFVVDPPALTVPKNIPTQINTSLMAPPTAGANVKEAVAALSAGALIEAELRGPSIPPTRISVPAGSPIPVPAFALPGDYFLDNIRLVKNGQTILDATAPDGRPATTIPIKVISEVFVTSVTTRPLTLDEIREKGILIDSSSYQAVNFQAAFNIDGQSFTIDMPAVLPTPQLLQLTSDRATLIKEVSLINQTLASTQTTLPPEFDRPGINFSIAALPFFFVPDEDGGVPSLDIPPITGLVVIAGNVAFLNQFFKVAVLVTNVTPEGSSLVLRDVTGTVALPTGLDRIPGTPEQPGDDPLRLARLDGGIVRGTVPIVQTGPDGVLGTADDIAIVPPQKQAEGEILLEGLKEGGHAFEIGIDAFLDGLPSGPVRLLGLAAGAVFVRNPTFSVTLAHPRTIRSGETYDIYATVTNTSRSIANLVSVNLDPLSISGAQLLSDPTVSFETIAAGQSATAKYTLRAQQTGEVTFSSFTGDVAAGGGIRLFTGVGERNVPLSPNAIVLPKATEALPASLIAAAQRVLGQAFSIATAPPEALPPDVLFVKRQTVIDRGLELAQAGERVQFGEPLERVIKDLLLDWLGNTTFDEGFDQLLRSTEAGAAFVGEIAALVGPDVLTVGALTYQHAFAALGAARANPHVSVITAGSGGVPSPVLTVNRSDGSAVREGAPGSTTLAGGALLGLADPGAAAALGVLALIEPAVHVFEIVARAAGIYDLGIVVPVAQPGVLQQLRYSGIALGTGGVARVEIDLSAPGTPSLRIDATGDGVFESALAAQTIAVAETPPQVLAAKQLQSLVREAPGDLADPATYGLIAGVLFDKPVTRASAETKSNYTIANNAVIGTRLQQSGRLVYLYLERPIGGLTPRSLGVAGISDLRGLSLGSPQVPIQMALTDGGRVFGQVREAGGGGVPDAVLKLTVVGEGGRNFDVSTIRVDQNGSFDFDFVPRIGQYFSLKAQHPITRDLTQLSARIRGAGEQLLLNPTFAGRGTVRGRLLAPDGVSVVPNVPVALIAGAVLGLAGFQVHTNALGEFVFTDVPVGIFTLSASDGERAFAQAPGLLPTAGQIVVQDLVLVTQPEAGGRLVGRVFLGDGVTPGARFSVYVGRYSRKEARIEAVDATTTDDSGSFAFARTLPTGLYDVVAVDPATGQLGVTNASVSANLTTSVGIVLESTGSVEGVVFNAQGQPVPGAVIAGGLALGTADANGFFRIEGVPAGARTIQAGDPVTRRRGSAAVTVVPGQTVSVAITLEARATITGRVLDANGTPMPRVSVRIPQSGGFTFVFTNSQGVYSFPDMPLGSYLIQAPGPSVDSLISFMLFNGYDPANAFTSGDDGGAGLPPPPSSSDANAVLAAYEQAVRRFFSVDESLLGLPMDSVGGFGWNKVELFQDSTTVVADVRFLPQGQVAGRTEDSFGNPTGAVVRVTGLAVGKTGAPIVAELGRMNSDAGSGLFGFGGIPRFDLATFQTAGVRGGDFTLEAAQPFSPAILSFRGQLNTSTPNLMDIILRFPSAAETNGTVAGQVVLPDGVTPAPANTQVHISFGDLTVLTDDSGRFVSLLPIPAGQYAVTATAPNGLRGQSRVLIPAGGNVDVQVRLLGLGSATIVVRRPNGLPVPHALVRLERATFPNDSADGQTDANGTVQFVNLTEGLVSVTAEEAVTGLRGRASGTIVRGGEIAIPLTIAGSGRVTGRFLTADGSQVIPFAQVVLTSGSVQAFAATDAAGAFELQAIPLGRFTVEANDPLTGRLGRANGELLFEGQTVDVTVLQLPRGTVSGIVLHADGATPVAAARVRLQTVSTIRTDLQATARADGGFRFDGIPEGAFEIEATDPVSGFRGKASGRITFEGEIADMVVTLEPFGTVRVTVLDVTGQPVGNASVTIGAHNFSRTAAVDPLGHAVFEHLPFGTYRVIARSLSNAGDGGEVSAVIDAANETVETTVQFRGTGTVNVLVVAADGTTPVASAQVTVNARAAFGNDPPGPVTGTFNGFTSASGVVTFVDVPVGEFFARGEAAALGGVATGTLPNPGGTASVTVQLGASGSIDGRVLLPDGTTPAAQAIVTLRFQSQSQQPGVLQVTTALGGTFEFRGIPLGTFTVSAFEVVSSGVRTRTGSLTANGEHVALGDLVLDGAGPRVVTIDPAEGAVGVAPDAAIAITFNEPMQPATVQVNGATANVVLLRGTEIVQVMAPAFSDANQTVTLRPVQPFVSGASYTVSIKGAPDGPRDESGFPLPDSFVSTFSARDTIPPVVVSVAPVNDAAGVLPEAVVRVAFSEPVSGATAVLRTSAGSIVPGTSALTSGNAVVVFTPQNFLQPNTSYTLTVSGVFDAAGNALAPAVFSSTFFTVDTLAPVISALQVSGAARAGSTISVEALVGDADTARVEFRISDGTAIVSTSRPFVASFTMPLALPTTTISAVAVDFTGNRSSVFEQVVSIEANTPPSVTLTNLAGTTEVTQGQTLGFEVRAVDDSAVAQVLFSAVGATSVTSVHTVSGTQADVTVPFSVFVPPSAGSGQSITVQAAAVDSGGLQSAPASLVLTVRDGISPSISVLSPVNNAVVVPGQLVNVVVDVTDDVALATATLVCSPVAAGCESRDLSGISTRQTFQVTVPEHLQAPQTLTLSIVATDLAGNMSTAGRVLQIADAVKPSISALEPVSGSTQVLAGSIVSLRATVSDNVGVTTLLFSTTGALTTSGTAAVSPPVTSGSVVFSIGVPANAPNGSTITVNARVRDAAGNVNDTDATLVLTIGDASAPTVEFLEPADGTQVNPGQTLTVRARAADDTGVTRITITATGVFGAVEHRDFAPAATPVEATFSLSIPQLTAAGEITLTLTAIDVAGGTSVPVQRTVIVRDVVAPQVRILSPAADALFDPRAPIAVTVEATDAVGVTRVAFSASGAASASEVRILAEPAGVRTEAFILTVDPLPAAGGGVTLTASARDAAGNEGSAPPIQIRLMDVVAPDVLSTVPAAGATAVDPSAAVLVRFTERMDRATLTSAHLQLRRGAEIIAATVTPNATDDEVTLTPAGPLSLNTAIAIVVTTGVTDMAGNALAAERTFTFTTASPDTESPRVSAIDPPDNAQNVSLVAQVIVTFTEPIDPTTISPQSFSVRIGSTSVTGDFAFGAANAQVRFVAAEPYPADALVTVSLTNAITDALGNPLVAADGSPLTEPLTFTFRTSPFGITRPTGTEVIENSTVLLEARTSAGSGITSVVFTVNGQTLSAVAGPPFTRTFDVGPASATPMLTIVASGRDAGGAEIARDERTFTVVVGLRVTPTLSGVPLAGTSTLRFSVSSPLSVDLPITLEAGDPLLVSFPVNPVVLVAGQSQVELQVAGVATGATAIIGRSARGDAAAIVAVSPLVSGMTLESVPAFAGAAVSNPPLAGYAAAAAGSTVSISIALLGAPADAETPVVVLSSNTATATATATTIGIGEVTTIVAITAHADGIATLIIRAGDHVRSIQVFVGTPPPGSVPVLLAPPAGAAIANPAAAGQVLTITGGQTAITLSLLSSPAGAATPVTVASLDPAIAIGSSDPIAAGATSATVTIQGIADGVTTLIVRAGSEVRSILVTVGTPVPGTEPLTLARSAGFAIVNAQGSGYAVAGVGGQTTVTLQLLSTPATSAVPVSVVSMNPAIATGQSAGVPVGSTSAVITITGNADGLATLVIEAAGQVRTLPVYVGTAASDAPPALAAPVGLSLPRTNTPGRLFGTPGLPTVATIGISLLPAPVASQTQVTVTSGNPTVALVGGAASTTVTIAAGDQVLQLLLGLTGTEGAALLTLEFDGQRRELLVIVGNPPASEIPAVVAPVTGIRIDGA